MRELCRSLQAVGFINMIALGIRQRRTKANLINDNAITNDTNQSGRATLLSRQYCIVCPIAIIVYILLQFFIGMKSDLCMKEEDEPISDRVFYFYNGAGFTFVISAIQQIVRIMECKLHWGDNNSQGIYFTVFTVSAIAASSFILTSTIQWGGICKDVLGVKSTAAQWAEWLVTVPIMVYMTLAMEDKAALTSYDIIIIAVFALAILSGFLLNFDTMPLALGYVLFILGCCSITVTIVLNSLTKRSFRDAMRDHSVSHSDYRRLLTKASKRRILTKLFVIVFPSFPLTHVLAQANVLDRDNTLIAYAICSLVAKLLFAGSVSDAYMSLEEGVNKLNLSTELCANKKRRQFLRYVFHEVRVPLNTISMGLIVMKEDHSKLSTASREAVEMMNGATNFMSDTLNDVLSMQKIEDGKMDLLMKPFAMGILMRGATTAVKGSADAKKITLSIESELEIPMDQRSYIGDRFRLEHVIVNFLSNAIKFSPDGSAITLRLTGEVMSHRSEVLPDKEIRSFGSRLFSAPSAALKSTESGGRNKHGSKVVQEPPISCLVTMLVIDEGTGIAKTDLDRLFTPYSQVQADLLQEGKGTGLGLVLAKEIVTLHGGTIVVESELGKGSAFGFCIPFELVPCSPSDLITVKPYGPVLKDKHLLDSSKCQEENEIELRNPDRVGDIKLMTHSTEREKILFMNKNFASASTLQLADEIDRAAEILIEKANQKVANLKARRKFLIVDGKAFSNSQLIELLSIDIICSAMILQTLHYTIFEYLFISID